MNGGKRIIFLDTNVILRYLLRDDEKQYSIAVDLLNSHDQFYITEGVLLETFYVLSRAYKVGREEALDVLIKLVETGKVRVYNYEEEFIIEALNLFKSNRKLDKLTDAILCLLKRRVHAEVLSFDRAVQEC